MPDPRRALSWLPVAVAVASLGAAGPDTRLPEAARAGDRKAVDVLLAAGAAVNTTEPDGTTALHWAVYRDDAAMTRRLLDARANVNLANRNGATSLTLACTNGNAAIVEQLLAAGADPSAAPSGAPPLISCASVGAAAAARMLVARGADVNRPDTWRGQTALMWAAAENHVSVMKVLLEAGAKVDARSSSGTFTALMFAVRQDARDAARLLIDEGADVNFTTPAGQTVLRVAINNRHYTLAAMLLDAGARPDTRDKQGTTPLHDLVTSRSPQRHSGNRFVAFNEGDSSQLDSLDLMKKLVAKGADPNARTEPVPVIHERWTDKGIYSAGRPFMDNGVNLGGATPYLLAAQAADVEAMRLLPTLGADPRLATHGNNTPLMVAAGIGFVEGSRHYRSEHDALEAVKLAVAAGVDVNATNANGQTALHGAVYRAANSIIRYLIASGARTDFQDELERTALKLAEQGFNQVASVIRRDSAAALLKELGAKSEPAPRTMKPPDAN
jgi:ankyrin repeat protein